MKVEDLKVFKNEKLGTIRNVKEGDKEYFYANDIANALGYSHPLKAINTHCKNPIKKVVEVPRGDRFQKVEANFITEGDIYRLIIRSKLPAAEQFEKWVFDEVLPTLRKQGAYISDTITPAQIKQAKKYLTEKGLKSLFKNTDEENIISEYRLARQAAGDKKEFDKLALELLQKRPLGANSNKLIYKIHKKQLKALTTQNKKLQDYIRSIEPADDEYTVLDYHGISVNYMYTGNGAELKKTERYKEWLEGFPVDQLPSVEGIDFKKPVNMWLKFNHDKRYDVSNLHKGLIDVMCNHWGKNDKLVQLKSCVTNEYTTKEEGKIYICIKQGVDIA